MIIIKSPEEIAILREGGRRLAAILARLAKEVRPDLPTLALEAEARRLIAEGGDTPSFLGYRGKGEKKEFPAALCVSVNDEIVHGIPHADKILRAGDVVGLDLGMMHRGLYTDAALTVPVGGVGAELQKLLEITKAALMVGIGAARAGRTTGDIGATIESLVKKAGRYGIVRDLAGHGVGRAVHEPPLIQNYGTRGAGARLEAGMVLAIEPMLTMGGEEILSGKDGFSCITKDGSIAAHFEHTIAITAHGAEILTQV